jgi:hypothetical protein
MATSVSEDEAVRGPEELAAAVAQVRHALARDGLAPLERLGDLAEAARHLPETVASPTAWLPLLDELSLLIEDLERHRHALAERIKDVTRRRQAGTAYHDAGRRT